MALPLPIKRDIDITEKRAYALRIELCPQSSELNVDTATAKATPLIAGLTSNFSEGFIFPNTAGDNANLIQHFIGSRSMEIIGSRQAYAYGYDRFRDEYVGRTGQERPMQPFPIFRYRPVVDLAVAYANKAITVSIPFGSTFTRIIPSETRDWTFADYALYGNDLRPENSPRSYEYSITTNDSKILCVGKINIGIDLKNIKPPPADLTVCGVKVT
jgi:hypothetical protein